MQLVLALEGSDLAAGNPCDRIGQAIDGSVFAHVTAGGVKDEMLTLTLQRGGRFWCRQSPLTGAYTQASTQSDEQNGNSTSES